VLSREKSSKVKLAVFAPGLLRIDRRLSDDEWNEIDGALTAIQRFGNDQHLFLIAKANYIELTGSIDNLRQQIQQRGLGKQGINVVRLELNRRLLNFLASVRSFHDQTLATLSRRYGEHSDQLEAFKRATHVEYDNHFSYRFSDQLRNYVQHYGFGIDHIQATSGIDDVGNRHSTLELDFGRDALLQSGFEWKPIVRDELALGEAQIDVLPMMAELDEALTRLGAKRIEIESPSALNALRTLDPYIAECQRIGEGIPYAIADDFTQNSGGVLVEFPMQTITMLKASLNTH
jgi:hypothetical protein